MVNKYNLKWNAQRLVAWISLELLDMLMEIKMDGRDNSDVFINNNESEVLLPTDFSNFLINVYNVVFSDVSAT